MLFRLTSLLRAFRKSRIDPKDRLEMVMETRLFWDGVTQPETLKWGWSDTRKALTAAVEAGRWHEAVMLMEHGESPNDYALNASWNTPLHWAALRGAPIPVIRDMLSLGAWRSIPNLDGHRPLDLALRQNRVHLADILTPQFVRPFSQSDLAQLQQHFHQHIHRLDEVRLHQLRLPELSVLLEQSEQKMVFEVPGMYGGYHYELDPDRLELTLIVEARSRMMGGPVPRYECSLREWKSVPSINMQ